MGSNYYLRDHPRALYRVETGTDRVSVWRRGEWEPVILSVAQLDGLGGDAYYRVKPADLKRVKVEAEGARWVCVVTERITGSGDSGDEETRVSCYHGPPRRNG